MQYLLSQEEYDQLCHANVTARYALSDDIQKLCTMVCNHMPVDWECEETKPWGCILTSGGNWYCDQCPVKDLCPYQGKKYSK